MQKIAISFLFGLNNEGNFSFKAIFENDLYLEQVALNRMGFPKIFFHYLILLTLLYLEEGLQLFIT